MVTSAACVELRTDQAGRDEIMTERSAVPVSDLALTTSQLKKKTFARYQAVSRLFAGEAVRETIATRVCFEASAEAVWDELMFYEEVPGRAPLLLRMFLTAPVRTEGDKRRAGAMVRCVYSGGAELMKCITRVEAPRSLYFEVIDQRLGIEDCIRTLKGSYEIRNCGEASEVVLTTNYEAYLRPRALWRRVEAALVSRLHQHILRGVSAAIQQTSAITHAKVQEARSTKRDIVAGGIACTISQSRSRR
jgi:hypothetical protein